MHTVLSAALVVVYVCVLTWVALRARAAREYEEFSLARRALPLPLIFGSLCATYVGPGFSIGFVGKGFTSGALFLGVGLAYSLQNILVGLFVAPRLRALDDCHTVGDAIGQKYDRRCHVFAGIISVSVCTFLAAVMAHAGKVVLTEMFGLPGWASVVIVVGVTALYTTSGGLRASVVTDAFQFAAFAILLPMILLLVLGFHFEGGASAFAEKLWAATGEGIAKRTQLEIVGLIAAFLLGETLIPPYANRAFASQTTGVSRNSFVMAGVFSVLWFVVMIALGILARGVVDIDTKEDYVLLILVKRIMAPEWQGVLLVVLVSVVMSSLDSLMNAGAVAFTQDIAKPVARLGNGSALATGRFATIAIALVAGLSTPFVPDIIDGLLICYTIWASAVLPALVLGLWLRRPRPLAALLSMTTGTVVSLVAIVLLFVDPEMGRFSVIIVPALAAALLAYLVGHLIGRERRA
ncbi:MAG: sodium:solute symporter family protein [Sedimentisphaerales bacterium]|nr:sodium:solute symporter family protein [Sedimentisphaerales bacterium]